MGLRTWTENKLGGSTIEEFFARAAKTNVELLFSAGDMVLFSAIVSFVIKFVLSVPGGTLAIGPMNVPVPKLSYIQLFIGLLIFFMYKEYTENVRCDYP